MKLAQLLSVCALILITSGYNTAQINITNLAEFQIGKLPDESASIFPSIYDRLEVDYRKKGFSLSSTIEQYHTTFDNRGYLDLSQFTLGYKKKKWDLKVGNFYETLGRGLLLRSFEFPGALLEDVGFRSRTYFHRDLLGASVKYKTKKATFHVVHADVLNNVLPPTFHREERRTDNITAVTSKVKYVKGQEAGIIFMRRDGADGNAQNFLSGLLNGSIIKGLDYYGEYATDMDDGAFALYSGLSGFKGSFSFSVEYRKYRDFSLGVGINEPPAGVKQQTYRVLNRSIHVSDPFNEEGYQIDLFYNFENGTVVNLNHSFSKNKFGTNFPIFRQYFLEVQSSFNENSDFKAFVDYSIDPFKREDRRYSFGFYSDLGLNEEIRLLPEVEYQSIDRNGSNYFNFNLLLGINVNSKIFISVLGELTDDPFIIQEGKSTRIYLGNTIRYRPSYKHTFQLFFGSRRGGPQCTSGVCYEILDFKGAEIRWIGKFKTKK